MVRRYSLTEARKKFARVVHEAEKGTRVELTRRGTPVAVLVGVEDCKRLSQPALSFWDSYEKFRQEFDLLELGIDPETDLLDFRDPSSTYSSDTRG
jgi:prevent-host-death family protein